MLSRIPKGLFGENPVFRLLLGLCPVLGVTTTAFNGFALGAATALVLLLSNLTVSLVKSLIPGAVRIPAFLVIIATYVSIVDLVMKTFAGALYQALGVFVPLIVVNCLILGRADAFASREGVFPSILDAVGMGLGFTLSITLVGGVRQILSSWFPIFGMPPGAFLALGLLFAAMAVQDGRAADKA